MTKPRPYHDKPAADSAAQAASASRTARPAVITPWRKKAAFTLIGLAVVGWRLATAPRRRLLPARGKQALLIEPYGMGDVISLVPLARRLLKAGWRVTVAARPQWRSCLPPHPRLAWIDLSLPWSIPSPRPSRQWPAAVIRSVRCLRRSGKGALGLDPRGDIRSVLLLYLAGCRRVITFSRYYVAADCRMPRGVGRVIAPPDNLPRWQVNLAMLALADPALPEERPSPPRLTHLIQPGIKERPDRLALAPMTPWQGKRWPAANWRQLLHETRRLGWRPIVLCGPGEDGAAGALAGGQVPVVVCGTPGEWVSNLQAAAALVCVNTGAMHIADAMGKPVILLNGSSQLPLWAPSNARSAVLCPLYRPCHETAVNLPLAMAAMSLIRPASVVEALERISARRPAKTGPKGTTQDCQ